MSEEVMQGECKGKNKMTQDGNKSVMWKDNFMTRSLRRLVEKAKSENAEYWGIPMATEEEGFLPVQEGELDKLPLYMAVVPRHVYYLHMALNGLIFLAFLVLGISAVAFSVAVFLPALLESWIFSWQRYAVSLIVALVTIVVFAIYPFEMNYETYRKPFQLARYAIKDEENDGK